MDETRAGGVAAGIGVRGRAGAGSNAYHEVVDMLALLSDFVALEAAAEAVSSV